MNKVLNWYKRNSLSIIGGIGLGSWFDILCNGLEFNFHHHNYGAGLLGFAIAGIFAVPRTLLVDRLEASNQFVEKLNNQPAETSHKIGCDCTDEELHEEALKEIDDYLNEKSL